MEWFKLNDLGLPTNEADYSAVGPSAPSCLLGTDQICAIQAEKELNNEPILSEELKDEMILALHNRSSSATVKLKKEL